MASETLRLVIATFAGPLFVGLFMWYLKRKVDDFFSTLNSNSQKLESLSRVVQGTDTRLGLLDIVESHDKELERNDGVRQHTMTRLRILERRVDRLAKRAEIRSSLADESDFHRRQSEQMMDDNVDRPDMDDIENNPSQTTD